VSDDLRLVLWKEWRSLLHGQSRRQLLLMTATLAFWAIWLPVQTGSDWMTDGILSILISVLLPALVVAITVPATIAGERERRTLPTLLATRLSDDAILLGKLIVPVVLGVAAMMAVLIVGLIAANVASWDGSVRLYDPVVIVPDLIIGTEVAIAAAAGGVAISLRARRVQDAQQTLTLMMLLPAMAVGLLLFLVTQLSGGIGVAADRLEGTSGWLIAVIVIIVLALVDVGLIAVARRRFQRGQLIAIP
jgi:ABC-2 type transport system permease protein